MSDGVVQVPADSTGKKIDTSEISRPADAVLVERQRMVLGDGSIFGNVATISGDGSVLVSQTADDIAVLMLQELRIISLLLIEGFGLTRQFDLDNMRSSLGQIAAGNGPQT